MFLWIRETNIKLGGKGVKLGRGLGDGSGASMILPLQASDFSVDRVRRVYRRGGTVSEDSEKRESLRFSSRGVGSNTQENNSSGGNSGHGITAERLLLIRDARKRESQHTNDNKNVPETHGLKRRSKEIHPTTSLILLMV